MTEKEEAREFYKKLIKKESVRTGTGGQSTNGPQPSRIILSLPELDITLSIGTERSQLQNFETAMTLMEMLIDQELDKRFKK